MKINHVLKLNGRISKQSSLKMLQQFKKKEKIVKKKKKNRKVQQIKRRFKKIKLTVKLKN